MAQDVRISAKYRIRDLTQNCHIDPVLVVDHSGPGVAGQG